MAYNVNILNLSSVCARIFTQSQCTLLVLLPGFLRRLWLPYINSRCVQRVLDVRRVELLDHLHAGAAVLSDLVDVGAFHQAHADIGVPEAVRGAPVAVAVEF
jgi:hypothetical protein